MMSEESTVSTSRGLIDDADARHECHTLNSQNKKVGTGPSEIRKFLHYPRFFFDRATGGLPKDEEAACCLWL